MAAINGYKRSAYGVLRDLVDTSVAGKSIFYAYKDKKLIGKEIFKELYARFHNVEGERKGFYMDDSQQIGILSQCQSLQALLLLASDFDLKFDDKHIVSDEEENMTLREIMDEVIEDVIRRIRTKEKGIYKFDASPYDTARYFSDKYSNIETITWVITSFLQALKYHAEIGETCKWQEQLVDVIAYGIKYVNKSFIKSENEGKTNKLEIGWNFTNDCEEPSLFYTFTVCECLVSFFETFSEYLTYRKAVRSKKNDKAMDNAFKKHMEDYERDLAKGDQGYSAEGKKLAQFDAYNELRLRYCEINGGLETIDGTIYGELEANCKAVAREVWRLSKEHLADHFFYNDLNTTLSEEDIAIATTSDALFNSVYIINILLDAGLDEDLALQRDTAIDEDEAAEADREYNNLFDACQLSSQKAFRAYEKLKTQGKEYIVEQFLVGFNENFGVHKDMVKELRKLRMRVFTLMPLLIRTNNAISKYLIKYPQINMRKYLGYILENRYEEKNKFKWIWENDGYFACSNYYYVSALGEFYAYYEEYEQKYIEAFTQNETGRATIVSEHMKELEAPGGDIDNLKRELRDRDDEIKKLSEKLDGVKTPVEDAVAEVVRAEMTRLLPEMLCAFLADAAKGLTVDDVDPTLATDTQKSFAGAMSSFLFAMLSKHILDQVKSGKVTKDENVKKYNELSAWVASRFQKDIKQYIANVKNSDGSTSKLFDDQY
ncbi:MAG: hypothetical protein IJV96_04205 [Clostridia bacterium]|nr:hypothetical protein [Clostridia bacterium]